MYDEPVKMALKTDEPNFTFKFDQQKCLWTMLCKWANGQLSKDTGIFSF